MEACAQLCPNSVLRNVGDPPLNSAHGPPLSGEVGSSMG